MADPNPRLISLKAQADDALLSALGADAYMEVLALIRELEDYVMGLEPADAAQALASINSLLVFRYAERRRDG